MWQFFVSLLAINCYAAVNGSLVVEVFWGYSCNLVAAQLQVFSLAAVAAVTYNSATYSLYSFYSY